MAIETPLRSAVRPYDYGNDLIFVLEYGLHVNWRTIKINQLVTLQVMDYDTAHEGLSFILPLLLGESSL